MTKTVYGGKGQGYEGEGGKICMIRCFQCGKENYAPAVSSGLCAWCGYDANRENKEAESDDSETAQA